MKFRNVGQVLLALVVSVGLSIGVTSCTNSYTVGYLYVTGSQYNQISGFNINNQTGKLTPVQKSPFGTSGSNPVRILVLSGGRFVYVLNNGDPSTGTASNISLFQIGGDGVLTFQASYYSQGNDSISMLADSSGSHLYVLDEYAPTTSKPCVASNGTAYPTGDISATSIDPNTGRLALITNAQVANPDGTQLTYFPLGCFRRVQTGGRIYLHRADRQHQQQRRANGLLLRSERVERAIDPDPERPVADRRRRDHQHQQRPGGSICLPA